MAMQRISRRVDGGDETTTADVAVVLAGLVLVGLLGSLSDLAPAHAALLLMVAIATLAWTLRSRVR